MNTLHMNLLKDTAKMKSQESLLKLLDKMNNRRKLYNLQECD